MAVLPTGPLQWGNRAMNWPTGPVERVCPDCVNRFVISRDEVAFYRARAEQQPEKAWALPLKCRECRHLARKARSAWATTQGTNPAGDKRP